jgi:hypothetical protein
MVSLQMCRELLGNDSTLSDTSLELLRDQLYALADIATTELIEQRRNGCFENPFGRGFQLLVCLKASAATKEVEEFEEFLRPLSIDEREELEERAAVLEFDGEIERNQAEKVVMMEHWRSRKQGRSNND